MTAVALISGDADGPVLASAEGLSFWGGVDPATGRVIDAHHPWHGACVTGAVMMMPTSRGSCSGSGVILDLALTGRGPAALVFSEPEDVLTLGALVAGAMFDRPIPVLRVGAEDFARLSACPHLRIGGDAIRGAGVSVPVTPLAAGDLDLTDDDRAMLNGDHGPAVAQAMAILCAMARAQGARALVDVARAHIDGCIYASPANLTFAARMADLGGRVRVPTTTNAISVDQANWRAQGVAPAFGEPAAALADAYLRMGCEASFTCAPYLLERPPAAGEVIAWAESNAVIHANSVLGARTAKHPDFLDLCMALTGRAPLSGVYLDDGRAARRVIAVAVPEGVDDAVWPLLGWLAGEVAPDRIPLLTGVGHLSPGPDDLKALCAAFGTTSAAPMLHVAGVTPEADRIAPDADHAHLGPADFARAWRALNTGGEAVDLVALGSPHASLAECRALAAGLAGRRAAIPVILTLGRAVLATARADGVLEALTAAGVRVIPDICWCSISEPVFPPATRTVMTSSGKYAHYGPGLSGRRMRFGGLSDCIAAALTGRAPAPPAWTGET